MILKRAGVYVHSVDSDIANAAYEALSGGCVLRDNAVVSWVTSKVDGTGRLDASSTIHVYLYHFTVIHVQLKPEQTFNW